MKLACLSVYAPTYLTVAKMLQKRSECKPINFEPTKTISSKDCQKRIHFYLIYSFCGRKLHLLSSN